MQKTLMGTSVKHTAIKNHLEHNSILNSVLSVKTKSLKLHNLHSSKVEIKNQIPAPLDFHAISRYENIINK